MIYKSYPDISNFYIKLIDEYNNDGYIDKYNSKNIRLLGPYTYDKYNTYITNNVKSLMNMRTKRKTKYNDI